MLADDAFDEYFDASAAGFFALQACLDDTSVVEHQNIACAQKVGQIGKNPVGKVLARNMQKSACAAYWRGRLRDQRRGKVKFKIVRVHWHPI